MPVLVFDCTMVDVNLASNWVTDVVSFDTFLGESAMYGSFNELVSFDTFLGEITATAPFPTDVLRVDCAMAEVGLASAWANDAVVFDCVMSEVMLST